MDRLRLADVRAVLGLVQDLSSLACATPVPQTFLERLRTVIPSVQIGYFDFEPRRPPRVFASVEVGDLEFPPHLDDAVAKIQDNPISVRWLTAADGAVRLSARVARRKLLTLSLYNDLMRPLGVEDELRLRLPAAPPRVVLLSLLSDGRFAERDRLILDLLAPHLTARREAMVSQRSPSVHLREREWEILGWVRLGKTNKEIAALLFISPETVRKHLENAFEKLGVHTRTAAVARAFRTAD